MKTLVVTDLHLMDEDLPFTREAVRNSLIILDELIRVVSLDKEIGLIVMLGDIVNRRPQNKATEMLWLNKFDKLKRLVNSRYREMPEIKYWNKEGTEGMLRNRLVSLKGNHDYEDNNRWNRNKSYFDELVENNIIVNPEALEFYDNGERYYYHLRGFGEGDKTMGEEYLKADKVIGFAHDWFYGEALPEKYNNYSSISRVRFWAEQSVYGMDAVIQGHSHSRYDPVEIKGIIKKGEKRDSYRTTTLYTPGSNARTNYTEDMFRDVGYNMIIDTEDFYIGDVFIPIKPYKDYFKLEENKLV